MAPRELLASGRPLRSRDALDLVLEIGAHDELVIERRAHPVDRDGDREVLVDGIEIGRRDAAFDHLQPVLGHDGERIDGGIDVLGHDLDAIVLEVALLDRDHGGGRRQRPHHPDPHGLLLRAGAPAKGERHEQGQGDFNRADHGVGSAFLSRPRAGTVPDAEFGTVPGLQRTTKRCCAASGTQPL